MSTNRNASSTFHHTRLMSNTKYRKVVRIRGLHELRDIRSQRLRADISDEDGSNYSPAISVSLQPINSAQLNPVATTRKHREKTRDVVEKCKMLQSILPNVVKDGPEVTLNVNSVLGKTLQYLRSIKTENVADNQSIEPETTNHQSLATLKITNADIPHFSKLRPLPMGGIANCKYWFSFDNAPFGIVICQIDGALITSNRYFQAMDHGVHVIQSIFSKVPEGISEVKCALYLVDLSLATAPNGPCI
jgi:hypothetical protein